jgi:3-phenylpropionate/trans-cinnamate dioxygenase ferredoxin reductase subunit
VLEEPELGVLDIPLLGQQEAEDLRLTVRPGVRVAGLVPAERAVRLETGEDIRGVGAILLATGGRALRLALPGADLPGIHTIRCFDDVAALRTDLAAAERVAVIGGGLIGTETAVTLARSGRTVHWIDAAPQPLAHLLAPQLADYLVERHCALGITLHRGARLSGFAARQGRLSAVTFADGSTLPVDVVVMGVGMAPEHGLAVEAGLDVSSGIHVDAGQRTRIPEIFAAGDVASFAVSGSDRRKRHEHWRAAEEQGANAARVMLGQPPTPPSVDWFWSDQGDHHIEMAGRRGTHSVTRQQDSGLAVFELEDDRLVGVASVGDVQAVRVGLRLIQSGTAVDPHQLADPSTNLRNLLRR